MNRLYSLNLRLIGLKLWIFLSLAYFLARVVFFVTVFIACLNWTPKVYEPLSKDWNLYASIWQSSKYLSLCLKYWELTSNYWENMLIPTLTLSLSFIFQKLGVNFQSKLVILISWIYRRYFCQSNELFPKLE